MKKPFTDSSAYANDDTTDAIGNDFISDIRALFGREAPLQVGPTFGHTSIGDTTPDASPFASSSSSSNSPSASSATILSSSTPISSPSSGALGDLYLLDDDGTVSAIT